MRKLLFVALLAAGCANLGTESSSEVAAPIEGAKAEAPAAMTEAAAAAMARPPGSYTAKEVYEKLSPLGNEYSKKQSFPKAEKVFEIVLPSEKPRGDEKGEWINSYVSVYFRDGETVNQITIQSENCNIERDKIDLLVVKNRVQAQVALISKTLFVTPFVLQDKYFVSLGPDLGKNVRVPIKEDYAPVLDMRLMRGISKCDGKTGVIFRYDFFMK